MLIRTTLTTIAIAAALGWLGPALDGIEDHSTEVQQAKDLEDAQRAAVVRQRFEKAAQHLCGPQSSWREISNNVIECTARRGLRSVRLSTTTLKE